MKKQVWVFLFVLVLILGSIPFAAQADSDVLNVPVKCREGVTITPLSIRTSDGKATKNDPGNGKEYVIVCFQLTNNTGRNYFFLCDLNLTAKQDGKKLDQTSPFNVIYEIVATKKAGQVYDSLPAKEIQPGETITGEIGWIVDRNWKELEVTYSYEEFGSASAVFTFRKNGLNSGLTELYRSDFTRADLDGWVINMCDGEVTKEGAVLVYNRTEDWQTLKRKFNLKSGVEYKVSADVYVSRHTGPTTFMITVEQDGANWVNLVSADVQWGQWTTIETNFTLQPFKEYSLYVETLNAPNLDFYIRNFTILGPKGGL